jgi:hypothetical protein
VNPSDLVDYARRDWQALDEVKRAYRRQRFRDGHHIEDAHRLYAFVVETHAGYPSAAERADDLAHHERMSAVFAGVADAFGV